MPRPRRITPEQVVDVLGDAPAPVPDPPAAPAPASVLPQSLQVGGAQQLTPEQVRIRELEDQLARQLGSTDPEQELEAPAPGETILIHFIADGLTALGRIWFRGQELEFTVGSRAYADTLDRRGVSWLALRDDPAGQERRWGEVKFRSGPWPGVAYGEAADKARFQALKPLSGGSVEPDRSEWARAGKQEAQRRRAAPRLPAV